MSGGDIAKAIARAHDLRVTARQCQAEAKEILDGLGIYGEERAYPAGNFIAKVTRTRRFDPATAQKNLTPEEFEAIQVTRPDSTRAKQVLAPEKYARTQREYDWEVRIVPVDEV